MPGIPENAATPRQLGSEAYAELCRQITELEQRRKRERRWLMRTKDEVYRRELGRLLGQALRACQHGGSTAN